MSKRKNNWLDMSLTTNVIAKLEIEGLHNWPDAQGVFPEVGFLSRAHRHICHITAKKQVNHDDRDVEFIMFKRDIQDYLYEKYYKKQDRCHRFGPMSCEMIARELYEQFDLEYCSVFEDNENGAEIYE